MVFCFAHGIVTRMSQRHFLDWHIKLWKAAGYFSASEPYTPTPEATSTAPEVTHEHRFPSTPYLPDEPLLLLVRFNDDYPTDIEHGNLQALLTRLKDLKPVYEALPWNSNERTYIHHEELDERLSVFIKGLEVAIGQNNDLVSVEGDANHYRPRD